MLPLVHREGRVMSGTEVATSHEQRPRSAMARVTAALYTTDTRVPGDVSLLLIITWRGV